MASDKRLTAFRLGEEDRRFIARLCEMTGLDSAAAAIRLAVREAVAMREQVMPPRARTKKGGA
jgi:hypothetical protein